MSTVRALTVQGAKVMLSRSGVDHSVLTFVQRHGDVVIGGPKELRRPAFHALLDRGLAVAPYSDRDEWSR